MFSFDVKESGELCRQLLELYNIVPDGWPTVYKAHLKAKKPLYEAIGPTGRIEVPCLLEQAPAQRHKSYLHAINEMREDEKCADLRRPLEYLKSYFLSDWIKTGVISAGRELSCMSGTTVKIRKGQKLSRAIAAYLRGCGVDNDRASWATDELLKKSYMAPQEGNVVLSVNAVDLLLTGEHAGFITCHALGGGHRSGNFQYLIDTQTAVAYFYREEREFVQHNGEMTGKLPVSLPFKIWRQLVVFDPTAKAIGFLRHYPSAMLSDEQHKKLRQLAAGVMAKMTDIPHQTWDLRPIPYSDDGKGFAINRAGNAYMDYVTLVMHNTAKDFVCVELPDPYCPMCAKVVRYGPGQLACSPCLKTLLPCIHCNTPTKGKMDAFVISFHNVCGACRFKHYTECPECKDITGHGNMVHGICVTCFEKEHALCCYCGKPDKQENQLRVRNMDYICKRCAKIQCVECMDCKLLVYSSDMQPLPKGNVVCRWCSVKRQTAEREARQEAARIVTTAVQYTTSSSTGITSTATSADMFFDPDL